VSVGKCKKCGGEPWAAETPCDWSATGRLYKVYCINEDAQTGWYENRVTAENIWDSYFGKNEPIVEKEIANIFSFGDALFYLKQGYSVSRLGWNGKGQDLTLQKPDQNSKMTKPYIYITTVQGDKIPWLASQTDMLEEDWCVI